MVEIREMADTRSEERFYRCGLAVTLRRRGTDLQLLTSDVSFQGAFVRTDEPPPANSLVRLVFTLPPDDGSLALSAHVPQVVRAGAAQDQYPGFHARFIGLNGPFKERWESLVWSLKRDHKQSVYTTVNFARPSYVNLVQQSIPEVATIRWQPASVEELARIVSEDIPQGTVFVAAAGAPAPGSKVLVELAHPVTGELLTLQGIVRRRGGATPGGAGEAGPGSGAEGVLVALSMLGPDARQALTDMVESVQVLPDYDVDLFARPSLSPGPA